MKRGSLLIVLFLLASFPSVGRSDGGCCPQCGHPDGCYEEFVTYRCKLVPDIKPIKKTVYECKEVPYCLHKLSRPFHGHCCPECEACPRFKRVLVKKEIVCGETCGTKCVVEENVSWLPKACCQCGYTPCQSAGPSPSMEVPPVQIDEPPPMPRPEAQSNANTEKNLVVANFQKWGLLPRAIRSSP